jgi:hypothetical protein
MKGSSMKKAVFVFLSVLLASAGYAQIIDITDKLQDLNPPVQKEKDIRALFSKMFPDKVVIVEVSTFGKVRPETEKPLHEYLMKRQQEAVKKGKKNVVFIGFNATNVLNSVFKWKLLTNYDSTCTPGFAIIYKEYLTTEADMGDHKGPDIENVDMKFIDFFNDELKQPW